MSVKAVSPHSPTGEGAITEYYQHPTEGFIPFDPRTRRFHQLKHHKPVYLPPEFHGKQPDIATCSEPSEGNVGCSKWAGCPFKAYKYVGPGYVIMKKVGTTSFASCYEYYETLRQGRPTSQLHYGIEGWELDTTRTTIDVLGSTPVTNPLGQTVSVSKSVWQKEIPDLLPPWWHLMKDKGLPLPLGAEMYPELVDAYRPEQPEEPKPKKRGKRA